jgi:hypothetical protein
MPINKLTDKSLTDTFVTDKLGFTPLSESDVQDQISDLVDSAPQALDTLNELAAALGDDANFASTVTTALSGKQATLVSGTNIKTVNNTSLLGSGNITISGGGTATDVTTTASSSNSNFKVPFANTTSNNTGNYTYLHDSGTNFTYNPSTNTLNNVTLGDTVTLPGAGPTIYGGVKGYVRSITYNSNSGGYEVFVLGENSAIGQYPERVMGVGHSISISNYVNNSVAIGNRVELGASSSTIVGHYSRSASSSTGTTIVGSESVANSGSSYGTIVGWFSQVSNEGSTALGYNAQASGNYSIALGSLARTGGYNNTTVIHNGNSTFTPSSTGFYATGITSGSSSNVLYYDSNTKKITYGAASGGDLALGDLTNVNISNPTSGQVLTYNGTNWVNADAGDGGSDVVITTSVIAPTNVFQYMSDYTGVYFTNTTDRDYFLAVLNSIKSIVAYFNQSAAVSVFLSSGQGFSLTITSNSTFSTYQNSVELGSTSRSSFSGPSSAFISIRFDVASADSPSTSLMIVNPTGRSSETSSLLGLFPPENLPYSVTVYPGNFSNSFYTGDSTNFFNPLSGSNVLVTVVTNTSNIIEFAHGNANIQTLSQQFTQSAPYISFILGKTTYDDGSGGGGGTPPPNWYTVASTNNAIQGSGATSSALSSWNNSILPLPPAWNPADRPMNYKIMGFGTSRAPAGAEFFQWQVSNANVYDGTKFTYSSNPNSYNPSGSSYSGWDITVGFACSFLVPGVFSQVYAQSNMPNISSSNYWNSGYYSGNMVSFNSSSVPSSVQRFRAVILIRGCSPSQNFQIWNSSGTAQLTPTLFEQFLYARSDRTYIAFLTIDDPTLTSQIRNQGFVILDPGGINNVVEYSMWFEE